MNSSVTLIGAGIVNLVTALYLSNKGYHITVLDRCVKPAFDALDSEHYGCTLGGLDARMHSLTESDNYNEKHSDVYSNMSDVFSARIRDLGWSAIRTANAEEQNFITTFKGIPLAAAAKYADNIYELTKESYCLWLSLFKEQNHLLQNTNINNYIYRTYESKAQMEEAALVQSKHDMLVSVLSRSEISEMIPGFSKDNTPLCGGLKIKGFTLQVHRLYGNIIRYLESCGVRFIWNTEIISIDEFKSIARSESGIDYHSDNFVISPGVYGPRLLNQFSSHKHNQAVLGIWKALPQLPNRFSYSLKIKTPGHTLEDVNVTPVMDNFGGHWLLLGGGYAYIGTRASSNTEWSRDDIDVLYKRMDYIADTYFPEHYKESLRNRSTHGNRYCIRPWTPTGLGLYEVRRTSDGLIIITGGHNTGGFTLATGVATAVLATLSGQSSKMQEYYADTYNY